MKVSSYMLSSYVSNRIITPAQRDVLLDAFSQGKNILVCGNLGVGKTTLLNCMTNELHRMGKRVSVLQNFNEFSLPDVRSIVPYYTFATPKEDYIKSIDSPRSSIIINEVEQAFSTPLLHALRRGRKGVYMGISSCSNENHALMRFALLCKSSFAEVAQFIDLVLCLESDHGNNRVIKHIKAVTGYNESISEFTLANLDTPSRGTMIAS